MDEKPAVVVGNFEIGLMLTDKRTIKMIGPVYAADSPEELSQRLDAWQDALDRQAIRADVLSKEARIAAMAADIDRMEYEAGVLIEKKGKEDKGKGNRLSTTEKAKLDSFEPAVLSYKREIDILSGAIAKGREKLKLNGATPAQ
jgi:hypothetical protein